MKHSQAADSFPEFPAGIAEALSKRGQLFEEDSETQQAIEAYTEAVARFGDSTDPKVRLWADRARQSYEALRK